MKPVKPFELAELNVDQHNFRLGSFDTQRAAVVAMITRHKAKLLPLAEDILEFGLNPGEPLWVAPDPREPGKHVVMEGNRRVTALKVMDNPGLAEGTTSQDLFRQFGRKFALAPRRTVDAAVFDSVEEAMPWVERRHVNEQSGVGIEWWDPFAQDRANVAKGRARNRSMILMEYFSPSSIEHLADKLDLADRTTNVDRVLNTFSSHFAKGLGITFGTSLQRLKLHDKERDEAMLMALLEACRNRTVDTFKRVEERKGFIAKVIAPWADGVSADAGEDRDGSSTEEELSAKPGQPTAEPSHEGTGGATKAKKPKPHPLDRLSLASRDPHQTFHVGNPRLAVLYRECRDLEVDKYTNAAGMMLRVFLELSVEAYLEGKSVPLTGSVAGYKSWSDKGIKLEDKIKVVLKELDPGKADKSLNYARSGVEKDPGTMHSTEKMHGYMHDPFNSPNAKEIKQSWDRWYPLFNHIHSALA